MTFISVKFLISFLILLFLYYGIGKSKKWDLQWICILLFNVFFIAINSLSGLMYISVAAVITYLTSRGIEQIKIKKEKNSKALAKGIMSLGLLLVLGIWAYFKYINIEASVLGISFYSFIAVGYIVDVYRGKYQAQTNFFRFLAFITFFAHIFQGPFVRYDLISTSLYKKHEFDFTSFGDGLLRFTYGVFKKMVIANRLSVVMANLLNEELNQGGIYVALLIVILPIQLYADFSGYMDMAVGLCHILGIELSENFKQPFFSKSIDEFWRRWHITLGAWFKEYVFYSISMGKLAQKLTKTGKKFLPKKTARLLPSYLSLIVVWTATGLWHGGAWNYIIWGWINLFCIMTSMMFKDYYASILNFLHIKATNKAWMCFQMLRTFVIFGFCELISDMTSMSAAIRFVKNMFAVNNYSLILSPVELFVGLENEEIVIALIGVIVVFIVDLLKEKKMDVIKLVHRLNLFPRYLFCIGFFYLTMFLSYMEGGILDFAYAQF